MSPGLPFEMGGEARVFCCPIDEKQGAKAGLLAAKNEFKKQVKKMKKDVDKSHLLGYNIICR